MAAGHWKMTETKIARFLAGPAPTAFTNTLAAKVRTISKDDGRNTIGEEQLYISQD